MSPTNDLTLPIPDFSLNEIPPGQSRAGYLRHMLSVGLSSADSGEDIPLQETTGVPRGKITLSPATIARLDAFSEDKNTNNSAAFLSLIFVGLAATKQAKAEEAAKGAAASPSKHSIKLPFVPNCSEQEAAWRAIQPAFDNKIVMFEGATGIGKGRVLALAGIHAAQTGKGPVWISTSTVKLVFDLYTEFMEIPASIRKRTTIAILPGRTEFVSKAALLRILEVYRAISAEGADLVERWVSDGAPVLYETPLSKSIADLGLTPGWLANDLRTLAPDFPVDDVLLRGHTVKGADQVQEDPAELVLNALRTEARENVDIIISTHAMLSIAAKMQWERIATRPKFLIVDEAHLLEQSVSNINSRRISFLSIASELREIGTALQGSKALQSAQKNLQIMKDVASRIDRPSNATNNDHINLSDIKKSDYLEFYAATRLFQKAISSGPLKEVESLSWYRTEIADILKAVDEILEVKANRKTSLTQVSLSWSPDRRFPSLTAGPRDVGDYLGFLWKTAENGGIACSATLYNVTDTGEYRCEYTRRLLSIPLSRLESQTPVIAAHVVKTPILHVPSEKLLHSGILIPPGISAKKQEVDDWLGKSSEIIARVVRGAVGGTMVLCTSYKQINGLKERLEQNSKIASRLVWSAPRKPFAVTEREFRDIAARGDKPVLLALGPAWTGVSLKDDAAAAEDDILLTDLVITRMPIGLNNTFSMMARIEKMQMHPIIQEALMGLKQGIGRLIRRPGVKNRHLWIMDARIWQTDGFGLPSLSRAAKRMLKDYKLGDPIV